MPARAGASVHWLVRLVVSAVVLGCARALEPGCLGDSTAPARSLLGTNVIAGEDGSISYEYDAELPNLPSGTRTMVYGAAADACEFDGIITIAGPSSFEGSSGNAALADYSTSARETTMMFLDWLNRERGGLTVGDQRFGMRVYWVGSDASQHQVANATAHAIRLGNADFAMSE